MEFETVYTCTENKAVGMTRSKCIFVLSILGLMPLSVNGFNFIGCYWNDENNTLSDHYPPAPTTIQCFLTCISADKGYTYAGTQMDPLACVCGKSIYNQEVQPIDCNVPCPTLSGDICGGHFRLAVYNITDESIPIIISQKATTTSPTSTNQAENLDCMCPCSFTTSKWDFLKDINITKDQLNEILKSEVDELQQNLTVNVKSTSAYKNTKKSASDRRTSSMLMGLAGGFIICIPIVLIISSDIIHVYNSINTKTRPLG
ncbi:unnamed protein product [Mytilus edulis]|uniref:WSC domain-containing protein n=1 Tax=Mytilus edulis TaxID=6550 RepID=A0A8S3SF20_MYTED|nr:unnamed protein product [Mytilus edulis]